MNEKLARQICEIIGWIYSKDNIAQQQVLTRLNYLITNLGEEQ